MDLSSLKGAIRDLDLGLFLNSMNDGAMTTVEVRDEASRVVGIFRFFGDEEQDKPTLETFSLFVEENQARKDAGLGPADLPEIIKQSRSRVYTTELPRALEGNELFPMPPGFPPSLVGKSEDEIGDIRTQLVYILLLRGYIGADLEAMVSSFLGRSVDFKLINKDIRGLKWAAEKHDEVDPDVIKYLHIQRLHAGARHCLKKNLMGTWVKIVQLLMQVDGTLDKEKRSSRGKGTEYVPDRIERHAISTAEQSTKLH